MGTPVAIVPGVWRYRVSVGTGWPGVSILRLDEVESWICSFYVSVAASEIVWADPSLRYTSMLVGRQATNKQTILRSVCQPWMPCTPYMPGIEGRTLHCFLGCCQTQQL